MKLRNLLLIVIILALTLAAGCQRDSEATKKQLVEIGNQYFEKGSYRAASLIRRYIESQQWDEDDKGFKITAATEP